MHKDNSVAIALCITIVQKSDMEVICFDTIE